MEKICKYCNKQFIVKNKQILYCSKECKHKQMYINRLKKTTKEVLNNKLKEWRINNKDKVMIYNNNIKNKYHNNIKYKKLNIKLALKWQKENPEKVKEIRKRNYIKYREEKLIYGFIWRNKNKESHTKSIKEWKSKNKQRCLNNYKKLRINDKTLNIRRRINRKYGVWIPLKLYNKSESLLKQLN